MNQATTSPQPHHTPTAMELELAALRKENEALKRKKEFSGSNLKISQKGAVSLYGMGRFPVTLYMEQWLKLIEITPDIAKFIADNSARLAIKPAKEA